jgi:hypothetical protein
MIDYRLRFNNLKPVDKLKLEDGPLKRQVKKKAENERI